jgi:hypothetical protein
MPRFSVLFLFATVMTLVLPFGVMQAGHPFSGIALGFVASVVWIGLFLTGIRRYGRVGYWFALASPIGLFWPLFVARWFIGAMAGDPRWMMP